MWLMSEIPLTMPKTPLPMPELSLLMPELPEPQQAIKKQPRMLS